MIYKSYQIEKKTKSFENKIILFYGENIGLKDDFKRELSSSKASIKNFTQDEVLKNQVSFFNSLFNVN